jgi:prepilin-type N-terminal cleavage/methylation domain-containing protein
MGEKGFTLIELLVVISIIAVLASVVFANLASARQKAAIAADALFADSVYHAIGDTAVGIWKFDDCSGTSVADFVGSNTGTVYGGATWSTDIPFGKGCSISLSGSGQYVRATAPTLPTGNKPRAITAWIKLTGAAGGGVGNIITTSQGDCTGHMFGLGTAGGHLAFWGGCVDHVSSLAIPSNKWTLVTANYDGNTTTLYVNGLSESFVTGALSSNASDVFIGAETTNGGASYRNYFPGLIYDVRVYGMNF